MPLWLLLLSPLLSPESTPVKVRLSHYEQMMQALIVDGILGTYYNTGLTACGVTNTDDEHIAAVSHLLYDSFP